MTDLRVGLIARADSSGLGIQTQNFAKFIPCAKVMVIDVSHLADGKEHCNKKADLSLFPDAQVVRGWYPSRAQMGVFLQDLDLVFTAETPYHYDLFLMAQARGIKTVLQYNWEFLDYLRNPHLPQPDLFVAPSLWHLKDHPFPEKTRILPVPIDTEVFSQLHESTTERRYLHVVGRPAIHDRNGTLDLLQSLHQTTRPMTVTIRCQHPGYVGSLIADHNIRTPDNVKLVVNSSPVKNYWDNYGCDDVLVLPRRYGGLCLPANEALGAGMPVLMPDIEPNNQWLPEDWLTAAYENGEFQARSPITLYSSYLSDLGDALDWFVEPKYLSSAQEVAYQYRELLSWKFLRDTYIDTFQKLVDGTLL